MRKFSNDKDDKLDVQTASPDIVVLPAEGEIRDAVNKLKTEARRDGKPFLVGVKQIVVQTIPAALGYVTNKPGDENKIFVDYYRIKNDIQKQNPGMSAEQLKQELIKELMRVLSHEKGHISAKLEGGETPAEEAEKATSQWMTHQFPTTARYMPETLLKLSAIFQEFVKRSMSS